MSTNQATLRSYDLDVMGIALRVATYRERYGFQPSAEPAQAAPSNVVNARGVKGLASLIGKYDDDPIWDEFPAFLEQYRREMDELSRD